MNSTWREGSVLLLSSFCCLVLTGCVRFYSSSASADAGAQQDQAWRTDRPQPDGRALDARTSDVSWPDTRASDLPRLDTRRVDLLQPDTRKPDSRPPDSARPDTTNPLLFSEDFASRSLSQWVLFGSPQPVWVASYAGRTGVFDNNGDSNNASGAVSKTYVTCSSGCTIEADVYVGFTDLNGCWSAASIGLAKDQYPNGSGWSETRGGADGVDFNLTAEGSACWMTPTDQQQHAWFYAGIYAEDGTSEGSGLLGNADAYDNKWTKLSIVVAADRSVAFYADGTLVWRPTKRVHSQVLAGRNLVLGVRSSGSAGKTYHDGITVKRW